MTGSHPFGGHGGRHYLHDLPLAEALRRWEEVMDAAGSRLPLGAETVPVAEALGRVTAEPVWATRSSPPFDSAAMDGVAVRVEETVGASETTPLRLRLHEQAMPVDTGDPMPDGYDAVIMLEQLQRVGDEVEILAAVPPYHHVRSVGEDVTAGELLLPEGHRMRPADVAAAASAGATRLTVRRRPMVIVAPTGDELVDVGEEPGPGRILDTNSLLLVSQVREAGAAVERLAITPDDPERLAEVLSAAARRCDLLLVNAGSSAGADDYTAQVVERLGRIAAHGVAVRPGHPVVLGTIGATPVIGVPGYPVSAALTVEIFALPLLAQMEGAAPAERPRAAARLARKLPSAMGEDEYVRVRLGRVGDGLVAAPLSRGAGVLTSLVRADGLLVVPAGQEGVHAGATVEVELLRGRSEIDRTIVAVGSHDLVLDLAGSWLRRRDPRVSLASSNVGSLGGLIAVRDGLCHLAGCHLLDPDTGEYTLPDVRRVLGDRSVEVIRLVQRRQGLIVSPGNPLGLRGLEDVSRPGVRYVNRQRGSGTRVLLDHELARRGIEPERVAGYRREEYTHLAVAAAVASGRADCGLGILAAARAFHLDFVPVAWEPYDLVIPARVPVLDPLFELLFDAGFRRAVEELGGYDTGQMGREIA
ncbi:MAG: molybdopterin biosynthesis protein [Gaiellales bacterium]